MPIRTRITGKAFRENVMRAKLKARHPLLMPGTRHNAIWQAIVQEGNPRGGITAAQLKQSCHLFHPQILKDLIDHRLVAKRGRNANNEFRYIGDEKGRGTYVQEVEVEVELLEDDRGRFFTRTTMTGQAGRPGRIVRSLARRRIKFNVPLPQEPGVIKVGGFVNVDTEDGFSTSSGHGPSRTIDAEATEVEDPLLLEATATIIDA